MGQKPVTSAVPPKLTYKNVHSVVCKHTRSLDNGGKPVSHTLPADLRLPSQVHSVTSSAAFLTPPESSLEARSRSYSLLFCGFAFSEISTFPRREFVKRIFCVFSQTPLFLYVISQWDTTGTPHRADSPRTSGCGRCSARGRTAPADGRNRTTPPGRAAFSGRSPPLPGPSRS